MMEESKLIDQIRRRFEVDISLAQPGILDGVEFKDGAYPDPIIQGAWWGFIKGSQAQKNVDVMLGDYFLKKSTNEDEKKAYVTYMKAINGVMDE